MVAVVARCQVLAVAGVKYISPKSMVPTQQPNQLPPYCVVCGHGSCKGPGTGCRGR
jgi:hypothetical protein